MAKHTLQLEDDLNFDLFGLCSHQRDYRVCWALNDKLNLHLEKSIEPFMVSGKKGEVISSHSFYEWYDELDLRDFYLIQNKCQNQFLIPEKAQIDYFLVVKEAGLVEIDDLLTQLKEISCILTAFYFDPNELRSSNKLIF